uniref:RNA-directed DNA polymerase n=1 Tax=Fagus sylvatica TaxID=28930 RepID=A0A2N9EP38_FAGSY
MPRSVPGPSRPAESPARQASGPSRRQLEIPEQPRPAESPARQASGPSRRQLEIPERSRPAGSQVGQAPTPSHPRTSTESSYKPTEHTRVAVSIASSSKHTKLHRHMDDQRTEGRGEGSVEVTRPQVQRSLVQSPSAASRADDSERVIAALRQEVDSLKKAARDMSTAKERLRKNFHKDEQGEASRSAHHEGWAESPSVKEKAVSSAETSATLREMRRKDGRPDKKVDEPRNEPRNKSSLPPTVPRKKVRRGEQGAVWKALDLISSSPFTDEIESAELPERFTAPQYSLLVWEKVALRWFNQLERGSIGSWSQMAEVFVGRVEEDGGNTNAVVSEVPVSPPVSRPPVRTTQAPKARSAPTSYAAPSYKAFHTVFKEPIHRLLDKIKGKPFFVWPSKLIGDPAVRNQNLYCFYHQDKGHVTENCHKYKTLLEQLVAAGHLSDYVESNSYWAPISSAHQVVSFSDEDLADVQMPHNDPLVITLRFGDYDVQRVLVDQGSFAEIMYKGLYEKLGLKEADLANFTTPVFGFTGESTIPMGKTTLPVLAGPINLQTEFIVVRGTSPYNAIVGRDWLHRMKAVPSTLHQKLRFPTEEGVMEINGDQAPAAVTDKLAAEKDPEKVYFDPSEPEFYFLIGTNLSVDDRQGLVTLLMGFRDVFAWSVYEAPGVSLDLACHSLNISGDAKPISQKRRKLAPERAEIVAKEVERLLEANAIRSVQYPTWLSNTVVVKKKNGKWRDEFPGCIPGLSSNSDGSIQTKRRQLSLHLKESYCYRVMPFGLKNAGATYQRMVTGMFGRLIGNTVEAYIDDMLIKSKKKTSHVEDLREVLEILRATKLRLNATKCLFGVSSGKFLGHMISYNGVEANPDQISALLNLQPPKDAKQVQRLTGMIAALGRFISRSADRCRPFFQLLGKRRKFLWDQDSVSEHAVSAVLVRETNEGQRPVFFVSKTMDETESRYLPLEKAALALIQAAKKLPHYFQANTVTVLTDLPLKMLMHSSDFSGRITRWGGKEASTESNYTPSPCVIGDSSEWKLFVDGASNMKGAGAGAVLVSPEGLILEQAVRLGFLASNNEAEYEALLIGEYSARDERMMTYLSITKSLLSKFESVQVEQVRREYNSHADILAKLATALESDLHRSVTVEVLSAPSTLIDTVDRVCGTNMEPSWMDPLIAYLRDNCLPQDPKAANVIKRKAPRYWLSKEGNLYKRSFSGPYLLCVHPSLVDDLLYEIHEGICGSHTGGRSLAHRAMSQGYWWPFMQSDAVRGVWILWALSLVHQETRSFLIVATDYFTKWVEAEPLSHIREVDTKRFLWKSIITRFGIPWAVISDNGTQFEGKLFKGFCSELGIRNFFSSPGISPVETVKLKFRIRTTKRRSTGETPFALAYGVEAVIPLEVGLPTTRTTEFDVEENESSLRMDLNLVEERRDMATIKLASYQHQMKRGYDKNIRPRSFQVGDLVLRKVVANTRNPSDGKLGPNWEGPYRVTSFAGVGVYRLTDLEGKSVLRPWNICNLKKYFY